MSSCNEIAEGAALRDEGIERAKRGKQRLILEGQIALINALLTSPDGTASIDDASTRDDLRREFGDGGKWRGEVVQGLSRKGLIEWARPDRSMRPSRHRGWLPRWRFIDRLKLIQHRGRLVSVLDFMNQEVSND